MKYSDLCHAFTKIIEIVRAGPRVVGYGGGGGALQAESLNRAAQAVSWGGEREVEKGVDSLAHWRGSGGPPPEIF